MKGHTSPAPAEPTCCVACGRARFRGPLMTRQKIDGLSEFVLLCDNRADCKRHEPVDTYPYIRVGP